MTATLIFPPGYYLWVFVELRWWCVLQKGFAFVPVSALGHYGIQVSCE